MTHPSMYDSSDARSYVFRHFRGMQVYQKDPWYVYVETRTGHNSVTDSYDYAVNYQVPIKRAIG